MKRELIGRLKALEETHSKVSPSVIQRAFQRLSESGQWPKDPAVLKVVQRIRLLSGRNGADHRCFRPRGCTSASGLSHG